MRAEIQAKSDDLYPNDPVLAAEKAHEERLVLARRLRTEGKYTPDQYSAFLRASEADLQRDIAQRGGLRRWDWMRIANFRSRTLRSEFWVAVVLALVASFFLGVLDGMIWPDGPGILYLAAIAVWVWLFWGAAVNRLHDMGHAGWVSLLFFVPLVNLGVIVWIGVDQGESLPNKWGPPVA